MAEAKKTVKRTKKAEPKEVSAKKGAKDGSIQESAEVKTLATEEPAKEIKAVAKAGKRSTKAIKEAEEKEAKEERKARQTEEQPEAKPKAVQKIVRSRLERRSKGFRKSAELIEKDKAYKVVEAMDLATKTSHVKFDATVELHVNLGVDPKQADQNVRDTVVLPAGTGKTVRVAVFADGDALVAGKKAGADVAGADEFLQQLDKEKIDFDILVATPTMMPKLGKYARLLGPKGLMPNPKSGTVATDTAKAVKEAKAGRVEYRVDSTGIVHTGIGKVSFGKEKLTENAKAVLASIKSNKPASIKSAYIKSVYASTAMGPSVLIDLTDINA